MHGKYVAHEVGRDQNSDGVNTCLAQVSTAKDFRLKAT